VLSRVVGEELVSCRDVGVGHCSRESGENCRLIPLYQQGVTLAPRQGGTLVDDVTDVDVTNYNDNDNDDLEAHSKTRRAIRSGRWLTEW
jgi:hypothetical protein